MARIIIGLLMILFINGTTTADNESKITVDLVETLIGWDTKVYERIKSYKDPDESRMNIRTIMKQVHEISDKLDALNNKLGVNFYTMLRTVLSSINIGKGRYRYNNRLRSYIRKIDNYFDASRAYRFGGEFVNETLSSFAHKALWSNGSVAALLDGIYRAMIDEEKSDLNFLSTVSERESFNIGQVCDTTVSLQQQVYYIYILLILTEMKGLLTQQHCLNIKHLFDDIPLNYIDELDRSKVLFEGRLRQYQRSFYRLMTQIPQHIRRCEAQTPKRGVHFLELQKFARSTFLDSNVIINDGCHKCPRPSKLRAESLRTNTTINNCKGMGTVVHASPSDPNSHRQYSWWKDNNGRHYGSNTNSTRPVSILHNTLKIGTSKYPLRTALQCQICVCSTYMNKTKSDDDSTIWRISVTEQISEIMNNKVVTGIRFVTQDNALHLQIKQAQFSHSGIVYNNSEWKDLQIGNYYHDSNEVLRMKYEPLRYDRRSIYLDDLKLREGYAVTGVRFQLVKPSAFELQVLETPFDFRTGKLNPLRTVWRHASAYPARKQDYKRKRIEIHMETPDDPTKASGFQHDLESNKFIKFTHSDIRKDGGQTTIPLLDAQPVETNPAFPLSGIGLSFRKRDGFGGYIAPHIHTFDVSKHVKMRKVDPVTTESSSVTREGKYGLPTTPSPTVVSKNYVKSQIPCRSCYPHSAPHVRQI